MKNQGLDVLSKLDQEECHPDANCIHGCNSSISFGKNMSLKGDVSEYKHPEVILRIAEKIQCPKERAEEIFEEMKQYLVSSLKREEPKSPGRTLDIAWHEFILFTSDYASFCDQYFGGFIHHVPTPRLTN